MTGAEAAAPMARAGSLRRAARWVAPLLILLLASCERGPALPELPQVSVKDAPQQVQDQIREASERVRKAPRDPAANGQLGMILHAYQEHSLAAILYQRARLLDPTAFRWAYDQASALEQLGQRTEAIAALRRALEIQPGEPWAQLKLADLLSAAGELAEARGLYEQLVSQHPDLVGGHYGLGRLFEREGNLEAAARQLETAIQVGGSFEAVHYALALVYRRLGKTAEAERQLALHQQHKDARLPTGPHLAEVRDLVQSDRGHVARGLRLIQAGQYREAVAEYEKAVQLNPQAVAAHSNLVLAYGNLGQIQKAEEHFREATARDPDNAPVHYNLGLLRMRAERYPEAAEALRRAVESDPYYVDAYLRLGMTLEQLGWPEQAFEQYQRAIASNPNFRDAHYRLGLLLSATGRSEKAIEHLTVSLDPGDTTTLPWRLQALGIAYGQARKYDLAESTLKRARKAAEQAQNGNLVAAIDRTLAQLAGARR